MKKVIVFSHTHWDREWYLSQRQFQFLLGKTFDEILDLLEGDDRFEAFVADGQTSIIEDYLEVRPLQRERLHRLLHDGRVVVGPWYTMPDTWIPDGESLIRNLLQGQLDCERLGLMPPRVGYVPDSFGHIEQMPQILNGFGIDNYLYSRGELLAGHGDLLQFIWVGPDGKSRVCAHSLPDAYLNGMMLDRAECAEALQRTIAPRLQQYFSQSACKDLALICNGVDHIWVQRDLPDILDTLRAQFPECEFIHGTLSDYLEAFSCDLQALLERHGSMLGAHLHTWLLHGTWSSRIDNKIANARACSALENLAEPLSLLAGWYGGQRHREEQRMAWRWALQCHAHDSICGCSIDRVHRDVNQRLTHVQEFAEMIAGEALQVLNGNALRDDTPRLVRYAGLGGTDGCVEFLVDRETPAHFHLCDAAGNRYPVQLLASRELVRRDYAKHEGQVVPETCWRFHEMRAVTQLPAATPCAVDHFELVAGEYCTTADPVTVNDHTLENSQLRVTVAENGTLNVLHKPTGKQYHGLLELTDEADCGGGYAFKPLDADTPLRSGACRATISALARGPLRGSLAVAFDWTLPAGLTRTRDARTTETVQCHVETQLTLDAGSAVLRCQMRVTNTARDHRLRLTLPTSLQTHVVDTERAFVVAREDITAYTAEAGQHQLAMRNWLSVADAEGGLAFIGKGLHEYSLTPSAEGSTVHITLLRAVPFVYDCGTWETPDAQLLGTQDYDYALDFHAGDWREGHVYQHAARFVHPAIAEVHGTTRVPWDEYPHASVWLGEVDGEQEYPVDTHRSSWRTLFGHRDGWRRRETSRLPQADIPECIIPIEFDHAAILVSALKHAERDPVGGQDGSDDIILRVYSVDESPLTTMVTFGVPVEAVWQSNLAEACLVPLELDTRQRCSIALVPFEISTLRIRPAATPQA